MSDKRPCTAEEIEQKRQAAIERLKKRKLNEQNDVMRKIEENRLKALELRKNKQGNSNLNKQGKPPVQSSITNYVKPISGSSNAQPAAASSLCKVRLVLKTHNTFNVFVSGFLPKLFNVFKEVPSFRYDTATKLNTFAISDYILLFQKLYDMKTEVQIADQIPRFVINILNTKISYEDPMWLNAIEPCLINSLNTYQKEAVIFGIARNGRILLGDDMGLGKTRQALAIVDFYKEDYPLLIVTNKSTRQFWADEIRFWISRETLKVHLNYQAKFFPHQL